MYYVAYIQEHVEWTNNIVHHMTSFFYHPVVYMAHIQSRRYKYIWQPENHTADASSFIHLEI